MSIPNIVTLIFAALACYFAGAQVAYSDPVNCNSVSWKRPDTYVTGEQMPPDRPIGYILYFSSDPQPSTGNASKIVDVVGPNSVQSQIPTELNDGLWYVRGTAYNVSAEGGKFESDYTNTAPFFLAGAKCYAPDTPSGATQLNLSFPAL